MTLSAHQPAAFFHAAVVDDDPRVRCLLALELEDLGVSPTCFSSAIELLNCEKLHQLRLILLDLMMPEMDGLACLTKLRQDYFHGTVVMVTANWEESRAQALLSAGADACWNKTAALERLAPLIAQLRQPTPPPG